MRETASLKQTKKSELDQWYICTHI